MACAEIIREFREFREFKEKELTRTPKIVND